jgi:hypothetical protein
MKVLARSTFVLVLTQEGRPDRNSFSTVSRSFTKSLRSRNNWAYDRQLLPKAS